MTESDNPDKELRDTSTDSSGSTDEDKLQEERSRWAWIKSHPFERNWRENSLKRLKYFTGEDQGWDEEGDREKLKTEKRPAITLNRIHPIIRLIVGARPRLESTFLPQGESGNTTISQVLNYCKDHVEEGNEWQFLEEEWFYHGLVLDRSAVWIMPDYDRDPRGEIELSLADGWNIYPDPDSLKRNRKDGLDLFEVKPVYKDWAIEQWPEKKEQILALTAYLESPGTAGMTHDIHQEDRYKDSPGDYYDPETKRVSLIQRWYKTFEKATKLVDLQSGEVYESPLSMDKAQKALQDLQIDTRYRVVEIHFTRVHYKIFSHNILFEEGLTPWERDDGQRTELSDNIPCVIFEPDRFVFGNKQELISIIEQAQDPQKYHNKLASLVLSIIGTSARSGYDYEEGAISKSEEEHLKDHGSTPGRMIKWNQGAISKGMVQKVKPDVIPQAEIMMSDKMAMELLDIAGVESLVSTKALGKSASGTAIAQKQAQGGNIIDWIYSSFTMFRHQLVGYEKDAIQAMYDYEKVIRIAGPKQRTVRLNEKTYDYLGAVDKTLNDVTVGRYDVKVREKPDLPSIRLERFKYFSEMVKSGALALPPQVINKIVLELMDDPDLKEIVEQELGQFMAQQQQMMAGGMIPPGGGGGGAPSLGGSRPTVPRRPRPGTVPVPVA